MRLGRVRIWILSVAFVLLAALPLLTALFDQPFYLTLASRIMIFAIAAISLDLILGFGGMVSLGHAAYMGIGAYAAGILSYHGIDSGWVQLPVAIAGSALVALIIGAICLRTSGIYFIMITLAMTQLLFFLGISLETYGGDDGLPTNRSHFADVFNLNNDTNLYFLILGFVVASLFISWRIVHSRFGMVVRGAKDNEARMVAIGFPTYRYKLLAFTIAGAMCGVAGFLLANLTEFVTPDFMHWFRSGEIMVMVLVGGMGSLFGPAFGAAAFLLFEEFASGLTRHWMAIFGPLLVLLVLFARQGLWGLIPGGGRRDG